MHSQSNEGWFIIVCFLNAIAAQSPTCWSLACQRLCLKSSLKKSVFIIKVFAVQIQSSPTKHTLSITIAQCDLHCPGTVPV